MAESFISTATNMAESTANLSQIKNAQLKVLEMHQNKVTTQNM